ncbi:MAG: hypothetical protein V2I35_04695 [Desulfocapsaceae bacterium]|jgi:hypothetical protein|nr:hypothetical protein [Desulfocapsaceae bacterium]
MDHAKSFTAQFHLITSMETGEGVPKEVADLAEQNPVRDKIFFTDKGIDCIEYVGSSMIRLGRQRMGSQPQIV